MSRRPHLDDETRGLIDAAVAAGRVQKVAPGTSGACVPRWQGKVTASRGRPESVANLRRIAPLFAAGMRISEIARETGIAYETVRRVVAALRGAVQGRVEVSAHAEAQLASAGPLSGSAAVDEKIGGEE